MIKEAGDGITFLTTVQDADGVDILASSIERVYASLFTSKSREVQFYDKDSAQVTVVDGLITVTFPASVTTSLSGKYYYACKVKLTGQEPATLEPYYPVTIFSRSPNFNRYT